MKHKKIPRKNVWASNPGRVDKHYLITILSNFVNNSISYEVSTNITESEYMRLLHLANLKGIAVEVLINSIFNEGLRSYGI